MKKYLLNWMLIVLLAGCNFYSKEEAIMHNAPAKANEHNNVEGNVNSNLAAIVAENFLESLTKGTDFKVSGIDSIVDYKGRTALYVFNFSPKGFVITSNNVCNEPIVAYSDEGGFEKINKETPVALLYWLSSTILLNEYIRENEDVPARVIQNNFLDWDLLDIHLTKEIIPSKFYLDPCTPKKWELTKENHIKEGPFMTTKWDQWYPYNYYAPSGCPAGCVAVALGQIMKFHKYPNDSNDPKFNWDIMPNHTRSILDIGAKNIAALLRDIGYNVNMIYTPTGSYARSSDARDALVYNYRYSNSANLDDYSYSRVKNNLADNHIPVYMDGCAQEITYYRRWWIFFVEKITIYKGCHAWVCDGYHTIERTFYNRECDMYIDTQTKLLHMNWGLKGKYNGWFSGLTVDYPPKNGTDEYFVDFDIIQKTLYPNFSYRRHCIYDIHP
jgi:thiol protease/hemagglutinin prtT